MSVHIVNEAACWAHYKATKDRGWLVVGNYVRDRGQWRRMTWMDRLTLEAGRQIMEKAR